MRSILFIITLLAFLFSEAQDVFLEPRKAVSFEEAQRDLASFYAALQAVHPSLYRYIDKNELDQKFQNAIASCKDSSDDQKIHLLVRQLITSIGCGHTVAKPSKEWYAAMKGNKAILPFSVFTLNNRIFLNKSYDYDSTVYERGTEILSINGHTSFDMLEQMRAIQQRDGLSSTFVEHSIKRTFQTYNLFLYGLPSEYVIEFKMNDSTQLVSFEAEKVKAQRYDPTTDSSTSTTLIKGKAMKLSADSQLEGALIMDINRFGTGGYKRFYRKAFKEIRKQQISNLVIDLRRNGGGYFPNGARLLRY
ncbi:MAG: hypothetical protein KDC83_11450, partial [Flavobacteriales bacterium]|nr:hypothetical protein [Flavobacteriales bacterium]